MAELGALEAMAGRLRGLGLGPLGPAPTAGTLSTPPKFPGEVRGYQEPSGAKQTGQDRDRTTHRNRKPSWAKLGSWGFLWAWRGVRGPYRVPQQPLPSQRQGGRWLEWPRGAACPKRVSTDKKMLVKIFLWAQQDKHGTPGRDMWTWSTGLGITEPWQVHLKKKEIYTSSESWINKLFIDVWFVMIGQYLAEIQIWKSGIWWCKKNLNWENHLKVVQMKFLAIYITNQ